MNFGKFSNHTSLIQHLLDLKTKEGLSKIGLASVLDVQPSMVSQILSGKRKLSLDQAFQVGEYLGLIGKELEFFLKLVELSRARNEKYKKKIEAEIEALRLDSDPSVGSEEPRALGESAKAIFYSDWYYSAIHLQLFAKPGLSKSQIATLLGITPQQVESALTFLLGVGLVRKEGKIYFAVEISTHLSEGSPYRSRHHLNWRAKASLKVSVPNPDQDFFLSCPMVLSADHAQLLRERLKRVVMEIRNEAVASGNEVFVCMNVDWFGL